MCVKSTRRRSTLIPFSFSQKHSRFDRGLLTLASMPTMPFCCCVGGIGGMGVERLDRFFFFQNLKHLPPPESRDRRGGRRDQASRTPARHASADPDAAAAVPALLSFSTTSLQPLTLPIVSTFQLVGYSNEYLCLNGGVRPR